MNTTTMKKIDVTAAEALGIAKAFASKADDVRGDVMPGHYHVQGLFDIDIIMKVGEDQKDKLCPQSIPWQKVALELMMRLSTEELDKTIAKMPQIAQKDFEDFSKRVAERFEALVEKTRKDQRGQVRCSNQYIQKIITETVPVR